MMRFGFLGSVDGKAARRNGYLDGIDSAGQPPG